VEGSIAFNGILFSEKYFQELSKLFSSCANTGTAITRQKTSLVIVLMRRLFFTLTKSPTANILFQYS
jgi:hypothetical protein